jgi:hypothetical protein
MDLAYAKIIEKHSKKDIILLRKGLKSFKNP